MTDTDRERIAKFVEAARDGKWTRRQTRNAIYHFKLREYRDAIFEALGFVVRYDPSDIGPDGNPIENAGVRLAAY